MTHEEVKSLDFFAVGSGRGKQGKVLARQSGIKEPISIY